jgi:hypothetical protein
MQKALGAANINTYLVDESWQFFTLENHVFPESEFLLLWGAMPAPQRKISEMYDDYALSSIYTAARPKSMGYRHEEDNPKLTKRQVQALTIFAEEDESIPSKRIWVNLVVKSDIVQTLEFYLKYTDLGLPSWEVSVMLEKLNAKGCSTDCCGLGAFHDSKAVTESFCKVVSHHGEELMSYLNNLSNEDTKSVSNAINIVSDIIFLLKHDDFSTLHGKELLLKFATNHLDLRVNTLAKLRHIKSDL